MIVRNRFSSTFYILTCAILCIGLCSSCLHSESHGKGRKAECWNEESFEKVLINTLNKIHADKSPTLSPCEMTAMLCFFNIDVKDMRVLSADIGIPRAGYYCFTTRTVLGNTLERVFLGSDLGRCDVEMLQHILLADFDALNVAKKIGDRYGTSLSYEHELWNKGINIKQRNIMLTANIVRLAGTNKYNKELLQIWKDNTQAEMIRDLCLDAVLANCDETSYLILRNHLLGKKMTLRERVNLLMHVFKSDTPFSIPFALVVKTFAEKILAGSNEQLRNMVLHEKASWTLRDFSLMGQHYGEKEILRFWLTNRDYSYCEDSVLNKWHLDIRAKYIDMTGTDRDRKDISMSQIRQARELLEEFDAKILQERTGLTRRRFKQLSLEKLLLWDIIGKAEKSDLRWQIPKH